MRLTWALNPLAGSRCFSYISHKILRWFVPHFMLVALVSGALLALTSPLYGLLFAGQVLFYFTYYYGLTLNDDKKGKLASIIKLVTFFVSMNISLGQGFIRFLTSKQSATWKSTAR